MKSDDGSPETHLEAWDPDGALAEIISTKETAEHVARDGTAEGVDATSVLAGLIAQLAEQVQRMLESQPSPHVGVTPPGSIDSLDEDIAPGEAPASPERDPDAGQDSSTASIDVGGSPPS